MQRSRLASFVFWCACALAIGHRESCAAAPDPRLAAAIPAIQEAIRKSGADVGVAFATLDGRTQWLYRADQPYHAASTMKVPVMIELFHQRQQGTLKLQDPLVVENEFHSLADGSIYTLDPKDDSETALYGAIGQTRTLDQLCELMITVSSNLATNLLMERLGVDNIQSAVHTLNADGMKVLRGVEDQKAFDKGLINTTTARGLLRLFDAIARGEAVDPESSRQMIEILERQSFNDGIPAGLPAGTRVAHKTGEITQIHHDAGIVFATRPFVLVILVHGLPDIHDSATLMAIITHQLYRATQ
jgi:beta-lactamase class A